MPHHQPGRFQCKSSGHALLTTGVTGFVSARFGRTSSAQVRARRELRHVVPFAGGLCKFLLNAARQLVLPSGSTNVYSPVISRLLWPAILDASIALPPTCWRHVMLALRKECGQGLGSRSLRLRPPDVVHLEHLSPKVVCQSTPLVKDPGVRFRFVLSRFSRKRWARSRRPGYGGCLTLGAPDVLMPDTLLDLDRGGIDVDVFHFRPSHFGDPRAVAMQVSRLIGSFHPSE